MAVLTAEQHVSLLKSAELQFRLVIAVRMACTFGNQPLKVPIAFTYGKQNVSGEEIALSPDDADRASAILEHTTMYTMALQVVQAMKDVLGKPREHPDETVRHAFEIARLVRNAYTHQPFRPVWSIDPHCVDKTFSVPRIAEVNTNGLSGQPVKWQDYGGMLALFRLSQYVRSILLPSEPVAITPPNDSPLTTKPGDVIQHGRLLLIASDNQAENVKAVPVDGPIELEGPDGVYTIRPSKT